MKTLIIRKLQFDASFPDLESVSERLDKEGKRDRIDEINWPGFPYRPEVSFSIGYTWNELLLKYYVTESNFKAEKTETNQEVYEDSCVEFFVSPSDDGIYYNFEFNGIGTCLMGSGTARAGRERADRELIASIRRLPSLGTSPVGHTDTVLSWTLTIAIPYRIFYRHRINTPEGKIFSANFYKCGDKLRIPHYVTWNRVGTERPDFHQPAFFGQLIFES